MGGTDAQSESNAISQQATENSLEQQQTDMENKKQADAIKGFQQMLQELP